MTTIMHWYPKFAELENTLRSGGRLPLNIYEKENVYTVQVEIPGVNPDTIRVVLDDEQLLIEATVPAEEVEGQRTLLRERRVGEFQRRIRLNQDIDRNGVEADYVDGVLTLTLPKSAQSRPRMIAVKNAKSN